MKRRSFFGRIIATVGCLFGWQTVDVGKIDLSQGARNHRVYLQKHPEILRERDAVWRDGESILFREHDRIIVCTPGRLDRIIWMP